MWPFTQKAEPAPASVTSEVAPGGAVNIDRLNADMAREYVRSIYIWRCVDMIGAMASSVPLIIQRAGETQLAAPEIDVMRLLARPNPQWTGAALQYFVAASIAVSNKAYLLRIRGAGGVTLELWPLSPTDVTPIYAFGSRMIEAFQVTDAGRVTLYEVDENGDSDVIYIRRPALNKATDKSPAAIAAAPGEVFTRILQRTADILSNSSNITGLLSTESEIAKAAVQEIKNRIAQFKIGNAESGGVLVTANAKWNMTRLNDDPTSALSVPIKDSIARDVVMIFGVPSQLAALPGQDTYNNLAMARVGFLTDTVLPGYINLYVSGLNHALMSSGAEIVADVEHIPAMIRARQDMTDMASRATMLSINEQRQLLGYPPFTDGDDSANVPVLLEELRLKRLAIEVQGGNVSNILSPASRGSTGAAPGGQDGNAA
jgi:HK97 family phage portal protein